MPLYKTLKPLVLASASPRRQEMLKKLGLNFTVQVASIDEQLLLDESPEDYVGRVAREKARTVCQKVPGGWVISADTAVVSGSEILGKPEGEHAAFEMLKKLSAKEHRVLTGFSVQCLEQKACYLEVVETKVYFNNLPDGVLQAYVNTGDPIDKAGAYGIQSYGGILVKAINGSYSNVVGLPLAELTAALINYEVIVPVL